MCRGLLGWRCCLPSEQAGWRRVQCGTRVLQNNQGCASHAHPSFQTVRSGNYDAYTYYGYGTNHPDLPSVRSSWLPAVHGFRALLCTRAVCCLGSLPTEQQGTQ